MSLVSPSSVSSEDWKHRLFAQAVMYWRCLSGAVNYLATIPAPKPNKPFRLIWMKILASQFWVLDSGVDLLRKLPAHPVQDCSVGEIARELGQSSLQQHRNMRSQGLGFDLRTGISTMAGPPRALQRRTPGPVTPHCSTPGTQQPGVKTVQQRHSHANTRHTIHQGR